MYSKKGKTTSESKEKAKFRATSAWKKFRIFIKKDRKIDELTGKKLLKGFQVHHFSEDLKSYKILEPERFAALNSTSHKIVHFFERYNWIYCLLNLCRIEHRMDFYQSKERTEEEQYLIGTLLSLLSLCGSPDAIKSVYEQAQYQVHLKAVPATQEHQNTFQASM